jgi:predicted N-acetyltransferase YhbS
MILVRNEQSNDLHAIRHVNECAFQGPTEENAVESLRAAEKAIISLVAIDARANFISTGGQGRVIHSSRELVLIRPL